MRAFQDFGLPAIVCRIPQGNPHTSAPSTYCSQQNDNTNTFYSRYVTRQHCQASKRANRERYWGTMAKTALAAITAVLFALGAHAEPGAGIVVAFVLFCCEYPAEITIFAANSSPKHCSRFVRHSATFAGAAAGFLVSYGLYSKLGCEYSQHERISQLGIPAFFGFFAVSAILWHFGVKFSWSSVLTSPFSLDLYSILALVFLLAFGIFVSCSVAWGGHCAREHFVARRKRAD